MAIIKEIKVALDLENRQNIQDNFNNLNIDGQTNAINIANHISSATAHNSSSIINNSEVPGVNVSAGLEGLQGQINAIVTTDSNATIGVYKANDGINTNDYSATITGLTLYAGLRVNLQVTNMNTASATFNLNNLGAKNIKSLVISKMGRMDR